MCVYTISPEVGAWAVDVCEHLYVTKVLQTELNSSTKVLLTAEPSRHPDNAFRYITYAYLHLWVDIVIRGYLKE